MDQEVFKAYATKWRDHYAKGQKNWSAAHHCAVSGSIICSLLAGAVLQFKSVDMSGLAAVLTTAAAALTSLATAGGFKRKWRSNRLSRSYVDQLLLDADAESPDFESLRVQLRDVIKMHDQAIVNDEDKEAPDSA